MKIEVGDIILHKKYGVGYVYSYGIIKDTVYATFAQHNENIGIYSDEVTRIAKGGPIKQEGIRVYSPAYGIGRVVKRCSVEGYYRVRFFSTNKLRDYNISDDRPKCWEDSNFPWDMIFSLGESTEFNPNKDEGRKNTIKSIIKQLTALLDD